MDDGSWMMWGGWRWIAIFGAMGMGTYFGWSIRGTHERMKRFREDLAAWKERQRKAADEMEGPTDV